MLWFIKKLVAAVKCFRSFYLPVYILREQSEIENTGLAAAYAGYSLIKRTYFGQLLFKAKPFSCALAGRCLFWKVPGMLKRLKLENEIITAEVSFFSMRFFMSKKGFIVPEWMDMSIDVSEPISKIKSRSESNIYNVERLIRKSRLTYEISQGKNSFEMFYNSMYIPYTKLRYNDAALIIPFREFKIMAKSSWMLLIKGKDGFIAGALLIRKHNKFFMSILGVKDGNWEYVRSGAIGAIYYFSILEAQKRGYSELCIGGTKPFLNDGLAKFKIGMTGRFDLKFNWGRDYLWIGSGDNPEKVKNLTENQPFIYLGKDFKFHYSG
jgi:hypothetical protein